MSEPFPTIENTAAWDLAKLRRKRDQAWEMAGLARKDNDMTDAHNQTLIARELSKIIGERLRAGETG